MACTDLQQLIHETTMQWAKEGKVKNLTGATSMWQKELGSTEMVGRPMRQVVSEAIVDVINDRNSKRKNLVVTRTATIAKEARVEENTRAQLKAVLKLLVEENPGLPTSPARRRHLNEVVKKLREQLFDAKQILREKQANARRIVSLVADWSQAEIGYTLNKCDPQAHTVADWSQAEIGYTQQARNCRL